VATAAVVVALGIYGTTGALFWTAFGVVAAFITLAIGLARDTVVPAASLLVLMLLVWAFLAA
jgi:hypothetical protein